MRDPRDPNTVLKVEGRSNKRLKHVFATLQRGESEDTLTSRVSEPQTGEWFAEFGDMTPPLEQGQHVVVIGVVMDGSSGEPDDAWSNALKIQ